MATPMDAKKNRQAAQAANSRRRKRRRRGARRSYFVFLLLFLLVTGLVLSLTVFFRVEEVVVVGTDQYDHADIIAASQIVVGENLFRTEKASQIEQRLVEQFPYIQSVQIHRKMPPKIELQITQAEPEAAMIEGEDVLLLGLNGKVLERGILLIPDTLPLVKGIDTGGAGPGQTLGPEAQEKLVMLRYLLDAVEKSDFYPITNVDLSDRLNIRIIYENRMVLELGSESELVAKLQRIKETLDRNPPDEIGTLYANDATSDRVVYSSKFDHQESPQTEVTDDPASSEQPESSQDALE